MRSRGLADVRFILAGDAQGRDGYVRELDALIAKLDLKDVVLRVGHCSDMPAALLAASVVAVPSTVPEAFGRIAVEAQAMGAMVVVSDIGAVPETVLAPPDPAGGAHRLAHAAGRPGRARGGAADALTSAPARARRSRGAPACMSSAISRSTQMNQTAGHLSFCRECIRAVSG